MSPGRWAKELIGKIDECVITGCVLDNEEGSSEETEYNYQTGVYGLVFQMNFRDAEKKSMDLHKSVPGLPFYRLVEFSRTGVIGKD